MSDRVRTRTVPDLEVRTDRWNRPCPECGDDEVEVRVTSTGEEVLCLTCGRLRDRRDAASNEPSEGVVKTNGADPNQERDEYIRKLRASGVGVDEIAKRLGLSESRVTQISQQKFPEVIVPRRTARYGRGDVLAAIRAFREERGTWPSWDQWNVEHHRPSGSVAVRCFGSWSAAVVAAKDGESEPLEKTGTTSSKTDHIQLGRRVRRSDKRDVELLALLSAGVKTSDVADHFGISTKRVNQIGLRNPRRRMRRRWTRDDVLAAIRAYRTQYGRWPTTTEWQAIRLKPSHGTISGIFGSWSAAVDEAAKGEGL